MKNKKIKFEDASKAQQRVMIAEDTLKMIEQGILIPRTGRYITSSIGFGNEHKSARQALKTQKIQCLVCELGGLFCSVVKFTNQLTLGSLESPSPDLFKRNGIFRKRLTKYFSNKQLGLIETAFEGNSVFAENFGCSQEQSENASCYKNNALFIDDFGDLSTKKVFIGILNNIIKNKGTFVV